ncbi:MAG: bifunctional diaminohydroxyphosphoribosylaminopyrimidine deaminase/5-amino-6-(5-phosphoribosylamino)uracil reductase RibD [Acidobacteriota bacterium]
MTDSFDVAMMRRALFHAARGAGRTTPNPMVGAVVVSPDGVVVGHGWHTQAGAAHAEVEALDAAGPRARGGTLYVTLEPCCHVGRTGPCTRRIVEAGIRRVVAAMQDPDARVCGRGFSELRRLGLVVDEGVCRDQATRLNEAFVAVKTKGRPFVMCKVATSLDARVAARRGVRTALTSASANRQTQLLRASVDAVAVGSQTVLVDDPILTVRDCRRVRPLTRVVFDRRLRVPPTARLFGTKDEGDVVVVTDRRAGRTRDRAAELEEVGAHVIEAASLREAMRLLVAFDVSSLLVEGGPTLHDALLRDKLVDRVHLVVAPCVLGADGVRWVDAAAWPRSSMSGVLARPYGPDVWMEADVHGAR